MRLLATLCVYAALGASCSSGGGGEIEPPPPPPQERPAFSASRAFADLEAQCNFGARTPGSDAHEQCGQFLAAALQADGARVVTQPFTSATGLDTHEYGFRNILGIFSEAAPGDPLLLAAHWDSRARADHDPDPARRTMPVPGANDGASGVAVLLELGRAFSASAPPRPVIIALLDAEDQGSESTSLPYAGWIIGSRYLATHWPAELPWPKQMILLDLVGGDSLHNDRIGTPSMSDDVFSLPMELNSLQKSPDLVDRVWTIAAHLGHDAFKRQRGVSVIDDHVPFLDAGVEAIDIIEFVPPEWHTTDDTPANCSSDSLLQVGDTVSEYVYSR